MIPTPPSLRNRQGGTAHAGKATGDDPEPGQDDLGDDITVFLSALPQFVGGADFDKMTNRQLLAIKNHKPGLWHNKAVEELTRRKSSDLPMQPVPVPHGPQVGKAA